MKAHTLFSRFLKELEVPYTYRYADKLYEEHPYKYTLYGLARLLDEYQIENQAFRITHKNELEKLSTPFLAQISNDFVIVNELTQQEITYDWNGEKIQTTRTRFDELWSGIVLLAYPDEQSIEPKWTEHNQQDKLELGKKMLNYTCWLFIALFFFLQHGLHQNGLITQLLFVNSLGVAVSYLLLLKQLHIQSNTADHICNLLKQSSCNNILETRAARFLNLASWSEIGFSFFTGNLLLLLLAPSSLPAVITLGICALPYTLWSVWYQKFRAQVWCPLCLIVQGILWLQFIVCLIAGVLPTWHTIFCWYLLPAICLYGALTLTLNRLLPLITQARKTRHWKQRLAALRTKNDVFQTLLQHETHYSIAQASNLLFGSPNASMFITVYSNPYCNPCARMHKRLHCLDAADCCIQYIFTSFATEYESINKYLIAAYQTYGPDKALEIFDAWYGKEGVRDETFFDGMQLDINHPRVLEEFNQHEVWRKESKLHATPTILVNGYKLPEGYQIEDLLYFTEKKMVCLNTKEDANQ